MYYRYFFIRLFRNDVQLISQERNHHKEAYQGVNRDNTTLRTEMSSLLAKIDKLTASKVILIFFLLNFTIRISFYFHYVNV